MTDVVFTVDDIFYARQNPAKLVAKLNTAQDGANATKIGTLASLSTTDKTDLVTAINEVLAKLGAIASLGTTVKTSMVAAANEINTGMHARVKAKIVAGAAAEGTADLVDTPTAVIAALAFVTASGAAATKQLLAATTDYTVATHTMTFVTDQSLNSILVIYTV